MTDIKINTFPSDDSKVKNFPVENESNIKSNTDNSINHQNLSVDTYSPSSASKDTNRSVVAMTKPELPAPSKEPVSFYDFLSAIANATLDFKQVVKESMLLQFDPKYKPTPTDFTSQTENILKISQLLEQLEDGDADPTLQIDKLKDLPVNINIKYVKEQLAEDPEFLIKQLESLLQLQLNSFYLGLNQNRLWSQLSKFDDLSKVRALIYQQTLTDDGGTLLLKNFDDNFERLLQNYLNKLLVTKLDQQELGAQTSDLKKLQKIKAANYLNLRESIQNAFISTVKAIGNRPQDQIFDQDLSRLIFALSFADNLVRNSSLVSTDLASAVVKISESLLALSAINLSLNRKFSYDFLHFDLDSNNVEQLVAKKIEQLFAKKRFQIQQSLGLTDLETDFILSLSHKILKSSPYFGLISKDKIDTALLTDSITAYLIGNAQQKLTLNEASSLAETVVDQLFFGEKSYTKESFKKQLHLELEDQNITLEASQKVTANLNIYTLPADFEKFTPEKIKAHWHESLSSHEILELSEAVQAQVDTLNSIINHELQQVGQSDRLEVMIDSVVKSELDLTHYKEGLTRLIPLEELLDKKEIKLNSEIII